MVKVLNIISDTNIGGAGRALINYLKYRDSSEFEVSVALPSGSMLLERIKAFGVPVYESNAMHDRSFNLSDIGKLRRIVKEADPDIVHTHGSMSGRIAGKQCGKAVVFTRHSAFPPNPRFTKGAGKAVFKFINEKYADRIIAVSPVCRDDLVKCGVASERIDVILNGVEPLSRSSEGECRDYRASLGLDPNVFTAGIIARIEPYKGHMYILEAVKMLRDEGRSIRVLVAGTGEFEDAVKIKAAELGVSDAVTFLGFVSDVRPLMSILDVQLNASYVEATSMSLLEGMSIGLPAVVSDYGGNPWVIEDGINGLIFKCRDSGDLKRRLVEVMDSPQLLNKLKIGAKLTYANKFTGKLFARGVEDTYRKVLEESRHGR